MQVSVPNLIDRDLVISYIFPAILSTLLEGVLLVMLVGWVQVSRFFWNLNLDFQILLVTAVLARFVSNLFSIAAVNSVTLMTPFSANEDLFGRWSAVSDAFSRLSSYPARRYGISTSEIYPRLLMFVPADLRFSIESSRRAFLQTTLLLQTFTKAFHLSLMVLLAISMFNIAYGEPATWFIVACCCLFGLINEEYFQFNKIHQMPWWMRVVRCVVQPEPVVWKILCSVFLAIAFQLARAWFAAEGFGKAIWCTTPIEIPAVRLITIAVFDYTLHRLIQVYCVRQLTDCVTWCEQMNSLFDIHRKELFEKLRVPQSSRWDDEREWKVLALFLQKGRVIEEQKLAAVRKEAIDSTRGYDSPTDDPAGGEVETGRQLHDLFEKVSLHLLKVVRILRAPKELWQGRRANLSDFYLSTHLQTPKEAFEEGVRIEKQFRAFKKTGKIPPKASLDED